MLTIAHLSDPHLDLSEERRRRFAAVLREVAALPRVDAILVSGDLADRGLAEEYESVFAELPNDVPLLVCAGNHDLTEPLSAALRRIGASGSMSDLLTIGGLTVIALDSHVDGRDDGLLAPETLSFARDAIASASGPVVLMMHHPPVAIGHHIVDAQYGLANPDDLAAVVRESPAIIAIFTGHIHAAFTTTFAGVPVLGAPGIVSTMRLGSRVNPIADSDALPGFALHTVDGAAIRTVFHTLSPRGLSQDGQSSSR
ncbi:metallophosphoesterase family protein [Microbacterium sp. ZW T5_56]|uniref:metallophosphoesterase family protein n=1 Tax=Microbacterium sp. ZW T5_56 TaxID=3378081 RepID=UPI00385531EE